MTENYYSFRWFYCATYFQGWKYSGERFGTWSIKFPIKSRKNRYYGKIGRSDFQSMHNATICSTEQDSAKSDGPISETKGSKISRNSDDSSEMAIDHDDWRAPLVRYLENTGHIANRKVQRQVLKYIMLDNILSRNYIWFIVKMLGFKSI
jgi:hypothetical protein